MSKYLVIVESPTKAKTILSILGKDYDVVSSMGHVVDLPANKISVDIENGFKPEFCVIAKKQKLIAQLKKKSKNKKIIYLATDSDREGEAISWHIKNELSQSKAKFKRVIFHEITEDALREAFNNPCDLDIDKVNAQMARRVLDRVVGYSLSPVLWKKIVRGLSAGRVQSIALKFIVEREKVILEFKPKTTYSVGGKFKAAQSLFEAKLGKYKGKKAIFQEKPEALKCIECLKLQEFTVKEVRKRQTVRKPPSPHITSLLQQDAFNKLRFSAEKTMRIAQSLYEGVQIGEKSVGLITYMRTDSFQISLKAKKEAGKFITKVYGKGYLSPKEYRHKAKKGAQLAHEAIRPTSINKTPQEMSKFLSDDEYKLYELIWMRFCAGFMKEAVYENTKVSIKSSDGEFDASGRRLIFDGYLKAYAEDGQDTELPSLEKGQKVQLQEIVPFEHITKPPARYNDASLVKLLEENGIGRPSTYAPTIYTLINRNYVQREKRAFIPTDLGIKVSNLLVKFFTKIMDENFTASMEEELDEVERGKMKWNKILTDFYPAFKKNVDRTMKLAKKEVEYSDKICPKCNARLVLKWSRRGRFLSCEKFPKCKYAESITTGVSCPGCKEGQLIQRRNRRGQNFYGCSKFPKCTYTSRALPENDEVPENSQDTNNPIKSLRDNGAGDSQNTNP